MPSPVRILIWFSGGVLGSLLALELLFRALPVGGQGVYAADPDPDWPVHHLIPRSRYLQSSSWNLLNVHRGSINNMGYVAPFDYAVGASGIVVLGNSYIESLMNDYAQTLQGSLGGYLALPQTVMQFGMSGSSMADYVGISSLVSRRFRPSWAVILVTSGDFVRGFSADDGHFYWVPGNPEAVELVPVRQRRASLKLVRESALFRYLRNNLRMSLAKFVEPKRALPAETRGCTPETLDSSDRSLLDTFARLLPERLSLPPDRVILVFDSDRQALYAGMGGSSGRSCATRDGLALNYLQRAAAEQGSNVVDTAPIFAEFYERTQQKLDYSPDDAHWNGLAHGLVARRVAEIINRGAAAAAPRQGIIAQ